MRERLAVLTPTEPEGHRPSDYGEKPGPLNAQVAPERDSRKPSGKDEDGGYVGVNARAELPAQAAGTDEYGEAP